VIVCALVDDGKRAVSTAPAMKEFYNCASLNLSPAQSNGQWHLMYPS
jgi:hypothetical protein